MVKHAQTVRRQEPTNCLSVFDHFEEFLWIWSHLMKKSLMENIHFKHFINSFVVQ